LAKQRNQELLDQKRAEILTKKQAKAEDLVSKAQKLSEFRAQAEAKAAQQREVKKQKETEKKKREQERREQALLAMSEKLEQKKSSQKGRTGPHSARIKGCSKTSRIFV